jgi:hypothetical protein
VQSWIGLHGKFKRASLLYVLNKQLVHLRSFQLLVFFPFQYCSRLCTEKEPWEADLVHMSTNASNFQNI